MNRSDEKVVDAVVGLFEMDTQSDKLKNAVQDLLSELRIDEYCLEIMAEGYSPDYPGARFPSMDSDWVNPKPKVQLSKVVAKKLIEAGVISCTDEV